MKKDFTDIKGQEHCKRGLEVAAAGNHGVLLIGPPDSGKTMLTERLETITDLPVNTWSKKKREFKGMVSYIMESCPCGYFTDPYKECHCTPYQIQRHLEKLPPLLMNIIDIHLNVPRLNYKELSMKRKGEKSKIIKARADKAKAIQKKRYSFGNNGGFWFYNSHIPPAQIEKYCILDKEGEELLKMAILELGISARAYDKILKVARTIADLEAKDKIEAHHISEAIAYRSMDRDFWMA